MRACSSMVALGLWLSAHTALADAVPAPPDDCPKGQVGITSHAGPACVLEAPKDCAPGYRGEVGGNCVLAACSTDQECSAGSRCVQVDACQELRRLNWSGWGWEARRARAAAGNVLAGPPMPAPPGDAPEAWVKLRICGQDGACNAPAECRPMGLCYPTSAIGKTKAKVVPAGPVAEKLPDGVYERSLIAPDQKREPENQGVPNSDGSCRKGCAVAASPAARCWLVLPALALAFAARRRRR